VATARSGELRAVAQRVANGFPPEVEEVLLTGSVSRGVADELSDVEMLLVGETLPTRDPIAAGLDVTDMHELPDRDGWWIGGTIEGVFFELVAWTRARTEERLDGILAVEIVDNRIRAAEGISHGVGLRTSGRIAEWKRRLADYPEPLVEAIILDAIREWTSQTPRGIRAQLRPGGRLESTMCLVDDLENVLRIVFALNRQWEPGWKRLQILVEPLAIKPERLAERVDQALRDSDVIAARTLVRDTLAFAPDLPQVVKARSRNEAILAELG
jgi:hypothetical protein